MKYEPNKAYLIRGSWGGMLIKMKKRKVKTMPVTLKVTPSLESVMSYEMYNGIRLAKERGYLDMNATLCDDNLIYLSAMVNQNCGDEDGYGVEPDDYISEVITSEGIIVEPFQIS